MSGAAELLARITSDPGLDEFCAVLGIELLVLFGSAAVDPGAAHDVDLAYVAPATASRLGIADAFAERFGDGVDLMPLRSAGPVARWEALGQGKILMERFPGLFAIEQMAAYGEWHDTREFRELALRVMSA